MMDNIMKEKFIGMKKNLPKDVMHNTRLVYTNKVVKDVTTEKIHIPKPILKWVGGKPQTIDKLIMDFPVEINNYRETKEFLKPILDKLYSFKKFLIN